MKRRTFVAGFAASALASPGALRAAQKLRVAKSIQGLFAYTPIDIGLANGTFQKAGVDLDVQTFGGAAKMNAAMIAGALDIALGSGSTLINVVRGESELAVAQTIGPPYELAIIVPYDSPIRTVDDLQGKTIGVATIGSVTEWMALELAKVKGWGPQGVQPVAIGDGPSSVAALRTHQIDAVIESASVAYDLEPQKVVRLLLPCASYVKAFVMHTIYASQAVVQTRPADLRAFLQAWFETTAFMRANRAVTVKIAATVNDNDPAAQAKEYDLIAPFLSVDGRFSRPGLDAIARSYVDLKMVDTLPDLSKTWTEQFLPPAR
jgi:NitT/TauT family transport system substrate-binding protein